MHSKNSPDGEAPVESLCEAAVSAGLQAVAVTDHCEMNGFSEEGYDRSVPRSHDEAAAAAEKYRGRLQVLRGVELGQATQGRADAEQLLQSLSYDIVLGSLHNLAGMPDFAFLDYSEAEPEALFSRYLDELLELVRWGRFDVLAHINYPVRYMVGEFGATLNPERFEKKIGFVLETLAAGGKALEINTSGYRQKLGRPLPDLWYLRRFRAAGGKLITFGSDAHRTCDVGANLRDGMALAKQAGFTEYALFVNRRPVPVTL